MVGVLLGVAKKGEEMERKENRQINVKVAFLL